MRELDLRRLIEPPSQSCVIGLPAESLTEFDSRRLTMRQLTTYARAATGESSKAAASLKAEKFATLFKWTVVCSFALGGTLVPNVPAFAQVPGGSYAKTCKDTYMLQDPNWSRMASTCKDRAGVYHYTLLNYVDQCAGDIVNDDGQLRCSHTKPPTGSYTKTCEVTTFDGLFLLSHCKDRSGKLHVTYMQPKNCFGRDIFNDNGNLRCGTGTPASGSYSRTCENAYMADTTLHATCKRRDGKLVTTSLSNPSQCRGDIANIDGKLTCVS